ncbi:MAG: hypothetical protein NZ694_07220, partial [Tepidimonas sp.]|nr:hypothetical protein [Tepidimonas sp.]
RAILRAHRAPLLAMGVATGLISAAPSVLWASGAMFIALAPLLLPLAIWIYALVFAFASLWFVHYTLAALAELRSATQAPAEAATADPLPRLTPQENPDAPR